MYRSRKLGPALRSALASFPAVLLTGPRQSGKTTLLKHELPDARYVTFDDPLERDLATTDPAAFLHRFTDHPAVLDEIQYVPSLLPHLKMRIDAEPDRLGRWVLTGSQQFGLMRDVSESLAGRVALLELPPFSAAELPRDSFEQAIWNGGYPIPALHPDRRELWLRSYVATYVERDVRQIRNVTDLRAFSQFVALAAARHGQVLNAADFARDLGLTLPTIKAWTSVLEASYVAHLLPPWHRNYGKRVSKTPKLYFFDSALVTYLTRQPDAAAALAGPMGGALLEGWVVSEAAKAFMAAGRKPDLWFWRSHDGLEVDLLILIGGKLQPIEIKLTATPSPGHADPLDRFCALAGADAIRPGLLVCRTDQERPLPGGHRAIPWSTFPSWLAERL